MRSTYSSKTGAPVAVLALVSLWVLIWSASAQASAPTVQSLAPNSGPAGGGTEVVISGQDLAGAEAVSFGAVAAASFVVESPSLIRAVSPPQSTASGLVHVTVTGPEGTSETGTQDRFAYGPMVDQVQPRQGPASGGTAVTISGLGLGEASSVSFGDTPATFTQAPDGTITAVSPPGLPGATVVPVTVTTPAGTSTTFTAPDGEPGNFFSYGPVITDISPSEGPVSGGTVVTIHGHGFASPVFRGLVGPFVHGVSFGSSELRCSLPWPSWLETCGAPAFEIRSDSEITAIAPPGQGVVAIRVATEGGSSPESGADLFGYRANLAAPSPVGASASDPGLASTAPRTAPRRPGCRRLTLKQLRRLHSRKDARRRGKRGHRDANRSEHGKKRPVCRRAAAHR